MGISEVVAQHLAKNVQVTAEINDSGGPATATTFAHLAILMAIVMHGVTATVLKSKI